MIAGSDAGHPVLIADACILISAEKGRLLQGLGRLGICTTDVVFGELHGKSTFGSVASDALEGAGIEMVPADFDLDVIRSLALPSSLSEADISCLMLAREHDKIVLTEDLNLNRTCKSNEVTVRGLDWLLALALDNSHLSCADVLDAFSLWRSDPREANLSRRPGMLAIESRCRGTS